MQACQRHQRPSCRRVRLCCVRCDLPLLIVLHCVLAQGLLCGVLQVIIQKLSETDATKPGVLQFGDAIMEVSTFSRI